MKELRLQVPRSAPVKRAGVVVVVVVPPDVRSRNYVPSTRHACMDAASAARRGHRRRNPGQPAARHAPYFSSHGPMHCGGGIWGRRTLHGMEKGGFASAGWLGLLMHAPHEAGDDSLTEARYAPRSRADANYRAGHYGTSRLHRSRAQSGP